MGCACMTIGHKLYLTPGYLMCNFQQLVAMQHIRTHAHARAHGHLQDRYSARPGLRLGALKKLKREEAKSGKGADEKKVGDTVREMRAYVSGERERIMRKRADEEQGG